MGERTRTALDHPHPCGACGAPWSRTERAVRFEPDGVEIWVPVGRDGKCSAACWELSVEEYDRELERRAGLTMSYRWVHHRRGRPEEPASDALQDVRKALIEGVDDDQGAAPVTVMEAPAGVSIGRSLANISLLDVAVSAAREA